jgi:hypothetical protein
VYEHNLGWDKISTFDVPGVTHRQETVTVDDNAMNIQATHSLDFVKEGRTGTRRGVVGGVKGVNPMRGKRMGFRIELITFAVRLHRPRETTSDCPLANN